MANSIRHQIMDAVIAALKGITVDNGYQTNVVTVSEELKHWEEMAFTDFPACFPIDADEVKEQSAITRMQSRLTVIVTSMVHDHKTAPHRGNANESMRLARTNLLRDVEKALMNDTTLAGLDVFTTPRRVVTDKGNIPNYSIFDQEFEILYHYTRLNGG